MPQSLLPWGPMQLYSSVQPPVHVFLLVLCSTRNTKFEFHSYGLQTETTAIYNSSPTRGINL